MDKLKFTQAFLYKFLSLSLVFLLGLFSQCRAQQTIINIPSSEVLPVGHIILKESNRVGSFSSGGVASLVPSVTFGLGHGIEFSTSAGTYIDANRNANVKSDISGKKVWFLGDSTRLTTGGVISPYFTQAVHPDTFIYTHLSHRIKKTKTSLTAGGYMNGQKHALNAGGVIVGIEQVIIPGKLRFAFDWLSGQDSYGKIGVGLKYRPVPSVSITSAVIIPNKDADNIAFNISISKFISLDDEHPIKRRLMNVD